MDAVSSLEYGDDVLGFLVILLDFHPNWRRPGGDVFVPGRSRGPPENSNFVHPIFRYYDGNPRDYLYVDDIQSHAFFEFHIAEDFHNKWSVRTSDLIAFLQGTLNYHIAGKFKCLQTRMVEYAWKGYFTTQDVNATSHLRSVANARATYRTAHAKAKADHLEVRRKDLEAAQVCFARNRMLETAYTPLPKIREHFMSKPKP
eukprot:CAMPEP_0175827294 /NCGR_PEP_ID=MMETSP0107_2-20121207/12212_1 /TAXON_ID=195067 ORGANISM="Goniomonas pacifica, Strain CCMP1869" /NCGR_SAMPLE_ID=MMETSP0107_2 /ASSEMBLY_ACC=CAM_ASM_000203 /LENGTH=200 /DNA_ID=CAMNT_0017139971 /DNA_START=99 /DNA_END=701 /DNA_ORIENTATION=-